MGSPPLDNLVNIGPGGTFRLSGTVQTRPADVDRIVAKIGDGGAGKVVVHFHGGLVSETRGLELAERIKPVYEDAGAYPITVVWETGLLETVVRNLESANKTKLFNKIVDYAIKHVAERVGGDIGAKGAPGGPDIDAVRAARAADDDIAVVPDEGAKGGAGINEGELELTIQMELEAEGDTAGLLDSAAPQTHLLAPDVEAELADDQAAKGVVSTALLAKKITQIVIATIKRFASHRDHGVIPTVVEETLRVAYLTDAGSWVWGGMKNAAVAMWGANDGAIDESSHAGSYLLASLAQLQTARPDVIIDLVGHSAGSIAIGGLLGAADERHPGLKIRNLVLLAPAARADTFKTEILDRADRYAAFRMFTMHDGLEREDHLVPGVYPRSLLYFISGALEKEADVAISGLERHFDGNGMRGWLSEPGKDRLVLSQTDDGAAAGFQTWSHKHGDFDDDERTLASLKAIIGA